MVTKVSRYSRERVFFAHIQWKIVLIFLDLDYESVDGIDGQSPDQSWIFFHYLMDSKEALTIIIVVLSYY